MGGAGLCHVEKEGLRFLVPVGHECEPLYEDPRRSQAEMISKSVIRFCVLRFILGDFD